MKKTCEQCKYFSKNMFESTEDESCCRYPPTEVKQKKAAWLEIDPLCCCGEWFPYQQKKW